MRTKKHLGQHFLRSTQAAREIARAGEIASEETVVEVGPGRGILTRKLLGVARSVIAIEKDRELVRYLEKEFADEVAGGRLKIIAGDARDLEEHIKAEQNTLGASYKIVANIPYYITGVLIRKIFSLPRLPARVVLLLQREVAERIVARDGKESMLSISVKAYARPRYIKTVPARLFRPAPEVDSAVVAFEDISRKNFKTVSERAFFEILKRGFAQKRKLLKSNLACSTQTLAACGIAERARAEDLTPAQWLCVTERISASKEKN